MRKISSENGSMAVYVSVVLLSMLLILLAIFLMSNQLRKAQIETVLGIKHSYEDDIEKADEIYANITGSTANIDYVEDGLILHYDAINNTGSGHSNNITTWKDLSGNSNDAIITGGIWENNSLRFTNANELNGVKTINNFPIEFSSNTFNIVFKLSDTTDVDPILGERTTNTDGFMLFNYERNNNISMDTKGSNTRISLGKRLSSNVNYNMTVTFSENIVNMYINGLLTSTGKFTKANINFPLTVFTAGTRTNSLGNVYSVKIYNRCLSDSEILQNYNADTQRFNVN